MHLPTPLLPFLSLSSALYHRIPPFHLPNSSLPSFPFPFPFSHPFQNASSSPNPLTVTLPPCITSPTTDKAFVTCDADISVGLFPAEDWQGNGTAVVLKAYQCESVERLGRASGFGGGVVGSLLVFGLGGCLLFDEPTCRDSGRAMLNQPSEGNAIPSLNLWLPSVVRGVRCHANTRYIPCGEGLGVECPWWQNVESELVVVPLEGELVLGNSR
ncbi:hypothetical protein P280DRAFT_198202 [Massarina eburnea CBS 473.64]|uniref:Uncharacterized protein n=1 Tax=Massarina eburnea CBS 473.64 TaxID=1395130 RepID=A0A6A6RJA8_9PLEO|nr:hypothetical protein P280DRAFT_198202 [Massarina eburnea CBS 473.64]